MIRAASGDTSSTREEEIMFVIDEAAKTGLHPVRLTPA
jgi:hypothetical protein